MRLRHWLLASGLCLLLSCPFESTAQILIKRKTEQEIERDPYLKAEALRKAGENEEALQSVNEAIRIAPRRAEAYALRSGILGNLGQFAEGIADADIALKLSDNPRIMAAAASNKGFNLIQLGQKREALEAYRLALQYNPRFAMAHFGRGKIFYFLGMWAEAQRALEKAVSIDSDIAAGWAYLAEAQFQLGDISSGEISAQNAVDLAPDDSRSFRARAIGHELNKRFEEMLADATRALELDPSRPRAHLLRGRALWLLGRQDEALAEYAQEPDRKAVAPFLAGVHNQMYGSRIYNCGDTSTTFELPGRPRIDTFEDCKTRLMEALLESSSESSATKERKSVPELPSRRRTAK